MVNRSLPLSLSLLASLLQTAAACGGGDDVVGDGPDSGASDPADARPATGRYFPMAIGATWTYRVEQTGASAGVKTQTVLALEDVGGSKAGVTAFHLRTDKPSGKYTISWQEDTGTAIVRHREQTFAADQSQETDEIYTPGKLRLDELPEHLGDGASFSESYTEQVTDYVNGGATASIDKTEQWVVEAVDVSVTVPAGTFDCLQLRRTSATTASDKRYWFARGVGKVREEGGGQTEQLTSFSLP